jgi:hypothetical protein
MTMKRSERVPLHIVLALLVAGASHTLLSQTRNEAHPGQVILDVTNYHVTMGRRIPSLYLRVFADRTIECHSLRYSGKEPTVVKKKVLSDKEFRELDDVVGQLYGLGGNKKYGLTHIVLDSWMEWDIKIPRITGEQDISIADFSPPGVETYPFEVERLGCLISRLRDEVYGDERVLRRDRCRDAFGAR